MKVRLLLPVFLVTGLVTFAAGGQLTGRLYAPILKYYSDCSYVAANGTQAEIWRIVGMLQRAEKPRFGLLDFKGKKVYAAIAATQGVILHPDPGIFGFGLPTLEYQFKTTPVEITEAGNGVVSIRVKRESTRPAIMFARPVGPNTDLSAKHGAFPADGLAVTVFTEIDEWIRVDGVWRLKAVRSYLV